MNTSESKKRKATESNDETGQLKKKRKKKKRDNNKFKIVQNQGFECRENEKSDATTLKEVDIATRSTGLMEKALEKEHSEKLNNHKSKKETKKIIMNQSKEEDSNERKKKDKIKCVSDNRCYKSTDSTIQAAIDNKEIPSNLETMEVVNQSESKKAKKKKQREKKKGHGCEDNSTITNSGQVTLEANQKQKRRKKNQDMEQDHSIPYEEPVSEKNFENFKVTSKNIVLPSGLQSKSGIHEKMTKQLESSRFRWINEQLYTTTGKEAAEMFSKDPNLFDIYHRGFTNQVRLWPVNPVDKIIEWLKKRPVSEVVADFGCGEAAIAQSVANKVHSFDLVAKNKFITACDMAKVPLSPASVDVAVFCLSLMGTNLFDFLREAQRVLKPGGILKVAEVASRINDTSEFVKSLTIIGFKLQNEDSTNKMFVLFDFVKVQDNRKSVSASKLEGLRLKPCLYKKR